MEAYAERIDALRVAISSAVERAEQLRADSEQLIDATRVLCEDADRARRALVRRLEGAPARR